MKRCTQLCLILMLCCTMLLGCTAKEDTADTTDATTSATVTEDTNTPEEEPSQDEATQEDTSEPQSTTEEEPLPEEDLVINPTVGGNVYMVTYVGYTTYPVDVTNSNAVGTEECEVLLRELLAGMEELTNWNLDVADIYMGKGGTTITFGEESVLIIGLTEDQVDEFFVYDQYSLLEFALGSIEKTVQMALTGAGGDPDLLDVYFSTADDQPLGFIEEGTIIPIDQPYSGFVTVEGEG